MNTKNLLFTSLLLSLLTTGCETTSQSSSSSSASSSTSRSSASNIPENRSPASRSSTSPSSGTYPNSTAPYGDPSTNSESTASDSINSEVLSDEESVAVLDAELDDSIAVFDGMILGERAKVRDIEDEYGETDLPGKTGSNEPLFEEGDVSEGGFGDDELTQPGTVPEPPGSTTGSSGTVSGNQKTGGSSGPQGETASTSNGIPDDIPDGSDDDIVARQIREAAMKEKDPVLKKKLWDEYRKYKNGK